ncbi:MAG: L-threonylcarbamoyladenylate synthase [Bacilli bacterium]
MTKIIDLKDGITEELKEAATALRNGSLVIFPTETVYGVGANALNSEAVSEIFISKGRANDNPLIVHISDFKDLNDLVTDINEVERRLMDAFMPGPFTIILPKKDIIPNNVSANLKTVGIRMPDNKIAHELIKLAGCPVAAPSANKSGKPSGTRIEDIISEFDGSVSYIIDGGETKVGLESTVVKVIDGVPTILRPGKITPEDIINIIGTCKIDDFIFKKAVGVVESPGMKYKHYAPNGKCLLVYSKDLDKLKNEIDKHIVKNTVVIGCEELKNDIKCEKYLSFGSIEDLDSISHNIFKLLREVDRLNPKLIIIMGVAKTGLGIAIMNRLIRSCSYNYIEV